MRASKRKGSAANPFEARFADDGLERHWSRLHQGDREPYPDATRITRIAKQSPALTAWLKAHGGADKVAAGVQDAWRQFHSGDFAGAIATGARLGPFGATPANKAAAIHSLQDGAKDPDGLLDEAVARGERAVAEAPDYANAHYMLALALGRHSQRLSILRALADGIATRVRRHLDTTLQLEPKHAEAQIALGIYHAEIVAKVGSLLAGLTYQASGSAALDHFRRALQLIPDAPIAHIEYANALTLLGGRAQGGQAAQEYAQAAALEPQDAMEQLDVQRAQRQRR